MATVAKALSGTDRSFGLIFKAVVVRSGRVVRLGRLVAVTVTEAAVLPLGGIGLVRPRHALSAVAFVTWCWTHSPHNRGTATKSSKSSKSAAAVRTVRARE